MQRLALVAVLLVAGGCGWLGGPSSHTLSLAYKAGQTYNYKFHTITKETVTTNDLSLPIEFEITAKESIKVKAVDKSGTADISITLSDVMYESSMAGTPTFTSTQPVTVDMRVASDGRIVSVAGTQTPTGSQLNLFSGVGGEFFITAVLPDHAVKPGDTWTKDYDQANTMGSGGVHVTSNSTYLRDESQSGVNAAVVETRRTTKIDMVFDQPGATESQISGQAVSGIVTTKVTTWIDPDGHRVLKTHATAAVDATMQARPPAAGGDTGPVVARGSSTTDLDPA